ncbi:hypothetical protein BST61_g11579 [Cercospora zeina]
MLLLTCLPLLALHTIVVDAFTDLKVADLSLPLRSGSVHLGKRGEDSATLRNGSYHVPFVDVTIGGQTLSLLLDTAIGDLDIFSQNFTCYTGWDQGSKPTTMDQCGQDALILYHSSELSSFTTDEHYNVTYRSAGLWLYGRTGNETVQLGDIAIEQKIALVQKGFWNTAGAGSFGLSFPAGGDFVFEGLDPSKDDQDTLVPYSTWLFTAISEGKFPPVFSHSFEPQVPAGEPGYGTLAFGGLPDVQHGEFASTPILKFEENDIGRPVPSAEHLKGVPYPEYYYYKINVDGWTVNGEPVENLPTGGAANYIIDTGTASSFIPEAVYNATALGFEPPGVFTDGDWKLDCTATIPELAVVIGGAKFVINKETITFQYTDGACYLNFTDMTGDDHNILGLDFLRDLVAVYDIGALQMRFAPRIR